MASFGKLATSRRLAPMMVQSTASGSNLGSLSLFSTAAAPAPTAASKKSPPPRNYFGRVIAPTTILPPSPSPRQQNPAWRMALQDLQKKQNEEANELQRMLDSLRIARMPPNTTIVPKQPQQQHTFQVMNRNARKPKRANHGKRPCSRIRRKYKIKKWANTRRKG